MTKNVQIYQIAVRRVKKRVPESVLKWRARREEDRETNDGLTVVNRVSVEADREEEEERVARDLR